MKTNRVANLLAVSILLTLISAGIKYFASHENAMPLNDKVRLDNEAFNNAVIYSSFALICLVSVVALKTLLDKDKKNKELLASLHEANQSLELKVLERTSELEKKSVLAEKLNRDLQDNFEELQTFYEGLHVSNAKAEDTLKELKDWYDNAPNGYHSLTSTGLIIRMNQTELQWLGYDRDEVLGKMQFTNIVAPEEHAEYNAQFAMFLAKGFIRNVRHTFVRKDGSRFNVLLNATAIYDTHGKYVMSRGATYLLNTGEEDIGKAL
ncbi:MAG: PAS domain-containing protein [Chryseolinea sp.]